VIAGTRRHPSPPVSTPSSPLRLLLLFQGMWEDEWFDALRRDGDVGLEREGFESFDYPHVLRLIGFDARRWLRKLAATYRGRIDATWSNDDQFAVLLAARLAQQLGLPGADPAAIVRAQHKLLLREAIAKALPEQAVAAAVLPWPLADRRCRDAAAIAEAVAAAGLRWPLFCKPVKGTFSALARKVDDAAALARHLSLPWRDRFLLTRCSRPFAQLAADVMPLPCGPDHVLLEELQQGRQVNVDGFVHRGDVHVLGVIDECMYESEVAGARHFAGFTLPSRLPADVQQRVANVATAAVRAVGYDHGLFNAELFVRPDGAVRVIEVNPRAAGQFATLYRAVAGVRFERLATALAAGLPPDSVPRLAPTAGVAASFVFRRFDGTAGPAASDDARAWLAAAHPTARLWTEPTSARVLRREYRWHGSHRFAVLNLSAPDFATLLRDGDECARRLFGIAAPLQ
jgi:hypothetical protein